MKNTKRLKKQTKTKQTNKSKTNRKELIRRFSKKKMISRWKDQEYLRLVELVREHGENWEQISHHFENKTAKQCMQKFKNSARSAKKGNWTGEEDQILMDWIHTHGANKWTDCSKNIKGRCGKQCRERWVNILNPGVKKGNWTDHEQDLIFLNLKRYFTSWSMMAKELEGRTENSIKNYFYSSIRRLKSNNVINYLREVYGREEENMQETPDNLDESENHINYPLELKMHVEFLVQNRNKISEEISKLNRLSKLICEFMLDFRQIKKVESGGLHFINWKNNFDTVNEDFLKFLIEIILELNKKKKKGRNYNRRKTFYRENMKGKANP